VGADGGGYPSAKTIRVVCWGKSYGQDEVLSRGVVMVRHDWLGGHLIRNAQIALCRGERQRLGKNKFLVGGGWHVYGWPAVLQRKGIPSPGDTGEPSSIVFKKEIWH